jgi:hypothetical protein
MFKTFIHTQTERISGACLPKKGSKLKKKAMTVLGAADMVEGKRTAMQIIDAMRRQQV